MATVGTFEIIAGTAVLVAVIATIAMMIAGSVRIAYRACVEEERQKARREMMRRAERIGRMRAREIVRHAEFRVEIVPVNESDIRWGGMK